MNPEVDEPSWLAKDIRRSLPEYRVREGDHVYNAPYRATEVDLNAFALEADSSVLQQLVDRQLNDVVERPALLGSQQRLHFQCTERWIVLIFAAFRSLGSLDRNDRSQGQVSALELSIWVPIQKRHDVVGAQVSNPAWYLPLVYTAPTASVATGREVYGYPKVPAYLAVPTVGGPPVGVELRRSLNENGSPSQVRNVDPGQRTVFHVQEPPIVAEAGWDPALLDQPLVRAVVSRFFSNVPIVFRKQAGIHGGEDGAELRAGYTALVESHVPITRLSRLAAIRPSESGSLLDVLDQGTANRLGIRDQNPLQGAAVRGCTLDIQHGSEIWVAAEPLPYVSPLQAPGNDIMRGSERGHYYDLSRTDAASDAVAEASASDVPLQVENAVGEVYFSKARRRSIAALLSRHFPPTLPAELKPTSDEDRQFVALTFVRAVGTHVLLYEFSVWVPVRYRGGPAWYAPYMFRSPGAAVIHAREWFGHPCQEAFIDFKDGAKERKVSINRPSSLGGESTHWQKRDGVVIQRFETSTEDALVAQYEQPASDYFNGTQLVVGLLQTRHASDTSRACFQEVVTSTRTLRATRHSGLRGEVSLESGLRLGRLLDLERGNHVLPGFRFEELSISSELPRRVD